VAQAMYIHVSKCKNSKIKGEKKKTLLLYTTLIQISQNTMDSYKRELHSKKMGKVFD
jgi:hypothetical protein